MQRTLTRILTVLAVVLASSALAGKPRPPNVFRRWPSTVRNSAGEAFDPTLTHSDILALVARAHGDGLQAGLIDRETAATAMEHALGSSYEYSERSDAQPPGVLRDTFVGSWYDPHVKQGSDEGFSVIRVVRNYEGVRASLTQQLAAAESTLKVDKNVALMPFVLVVMQPDGTQRLYPGAKHRPSFDAERAAIMTGDPMSPNGTPIVGHHGKANVQALREYEPPTGGFLIDGTIRGQIHPFKGLNDDRTESKDNLNASNEPYGPYAAASYWFERDTNSQTGVHGPRLPFPDSFRADWHDWRVEKKLVTLGPADDIGGILAGKYYFQDDAWIPKR